EAGASVTVFEKGSLGNGSTERSAGGIRKQFSTPINVKLSKMSFEVWDDFEARFGEDIDFRQSGYLFVALEEETADQFEATVRMQNDLGVETELLDPAEAVEYCEGLHQDRFLKGMYLGTDGFADPHLALQAFARNFAEAGGTFETHTEVTDVLVDDGAVVGVEVDGESKEYDVVVNAAGPWARQVAQMAGLDIPVRPKRRRIIVVDPSEPMPESVPLTIDLDRGPYFRPERDGSALAGGEYDEEDDPDYDPDTFPENVGMEYSATLLENLSDAASYFGEETRLKRGWAGLYAVTPDHHPIIEESMPGFVSAVGFSGHGFQHGPATGQLVTELIVEGAATSVDISRLNRQRFERGDLIEEQNVA
ncbi:MAG: NAD(P)/FAD-dependent oxidoreductase, partial [Halanaeroarchaeum sp.]